MIQKLYALVSGDCMPDNPDALQFQETLLPGHLYYAIVKEKIHDWLNAIKIQIQIDLKRQPSIVDFLDSKFMILSFLIPYWAKYMNKVFAKTSVAADIGKKLQYFLATGNLISTSVLDLQQV